MSYFPIYSDAATKDLERLDESMKSRIVTKIVEYCETGDPLPRAKHLTGPRAGLYRFRIGDYRAIFETNSRGDLIILFILRVRHRKDVYR